MVKMLLKIEANSQNKDENFNEKERFDNRTMRKAPYLPNFNKRPAKIIDPLVLASTWALGSQKWIPNTGILTKKGIRKRSLDQKLIEIKFILIKTKDSLNIIKITNKKGILKILV